MISIEKSYFNILLYFAQKSSPRAFAPLHNQIRKLYALSIPSCVEFSLNGFAPRQRSLVRLRGSTKSDQEFNVFLSDLDLEILIPQADEENTSEIRRKISRIKEIFPALGEAEIYTLDEKKRYEKLIKEADQIYSFLRKARKTVWMNRAFNQARTEYHKMKAVRSREICLRTLRGLSRGGESLSSWVGEFLSIQFPIATIASPEKYRGICADNQYMGMRIVLQSSSENEKPFRSDDLVLPVREGLLLLAISPNYFPNEALSGVIREIRNIPSVRSVYKNLSELELLIAQAVRRATPELIPLEWIESLKRSVNEATG